MAFFCTQAEVGRGHEELDDWLIRFNWGHSSLEIIEFLRYTGYVRPHSLEGVSDDLVTGDQENTRIDDELITGMTSLASMLKWRQILDW